MDVSFPTNVAPIRSHQKSHAGQPAKIHQSEATKTRDEASRSDNGAFSHAVDRSPPMTSAGSKPETWLRSPWTRPQSKNERDSAATLEMSRSRAGNATRAQNFASGSRSRRPAQSITPEAAFRGPSRSTVASENGAEDARSSRKPNRKKRMVAASSPETIRNLQLRPISAIKSGSFCAAIRSPGRPPH